MVGRPIALLGVILPLLLIGILKFTRIEIAALKPLISGTPWLAWLYPALGEAGASHLLGIVEIATALLLIASPWSPRAGVAGGALGTLTFFVTITMLFVLPIWEAKSGGFPWLNDLGSYGTTAAASGRTGQCTTPPRMARLPSSRSPALAWRRKTSWPT